MATSNSDWVKGLSIQMWRTEIKHLPELGFPGKDNVDKKEDKVYLAWNFVQ